MSDIAMLRQSKPVKLIDLAPPTFYGVKHGRSFTA
jgi:hypothetical protein